ncbi:unnamed protein product [Cylicocyclus nassatus]|uniref:Uncharacterized protein n=1 Tax=Cylicocyclus nassatus TaxID=53992 RepID=A0AA36H485_CYLNA|nr:unnamed protein product [Cylicocyclus nassatus]
MPVSSRKQRNTLSKSHRSSSRSARLKSTSTKLKSILKNKNDSSCICICNPKIKENSLVDTASIHRRRQRRSSGRTSSSKSISRRRSRSHRSHKRTSRKPLKSKAKRVTFFRGSRKKPARPSDIWWDSKGRPRDTNGRFVRFQS